MLNSLVNIHTQRARIFLYINYYYGIAANVSFPSHDSPWYNCNGWQGIKHQVITIIITITWIFRNLDIQHALFLIHIWIQKVKIFHSIINRYAIAPKILYSSLQYADLLFYSVLTKGLCVALFWCMEPDIISCGDDFIISGDDIISGDGV